MKTLMTGLYKRMPFGELIVGLALSVIVLLAVKQYLIIKDQRKEIEGLKEKIEYVNCIYDSPF